jgi:hypothetical protein
MDSDINYSDFPWSMYYAYTPLASQVNHVDSNGEYPRFKHWDESSIPKAARGLEIHDLWGVGSYQNVNLNYNFTKPSTYPDNQVNESPHGHIIEVDDTPGNERVMIRHRSGAGIDMRPDGSIIISSRRNRMQYVTGDDLLIVDGDCSIVHKGNVKMEVAGDFDVNVGGDYNLTVGGQVNKRIKGSEISCVEKNITETVVGTKAEKILGNRSSTVIGHRTDIVDGEFDLLVDDKAEFKFSDNLRVSSNKDINFASEAFQTVSKSVGVIAPEGTIGGEDVNHFGSVYAGPANGGGSGTTFIGSLAGIAAEAITSRYAKYAEEAHTGSVTRYAVVATNLSNIPVRPNADISFANRPDYKMEWIDRYTENSPGHKMPTSNIVNGILDTTDKGIVNFKVHGEDIKARLSHADDYNGTFLSDPSDNEARHVLSEEDNPKETNLYKILRAKGLIEDIDSDG